MNNQGPPNWILRLAPWWVMAVIVGYAVFTVLGSRTVQRLLGK